MFKKAWDYLGLPQFQHTASTDGVVLRL